MRDERWECRDMSVPLDGLPRVGALPSNPLSKWLWIKSEDLGRRVSTARFGTEFLERIAPWGEACGNERWHKYSRGGLDTRGRNLNDSRLDSESSPIFQVFGNKLECTWHAVKVYFKNERAQMRVSITIMRMYNLWRNCMSSIWASFYVYAGDV